MIIAAAYAYAIFAILFRCFYAAARFEPHAAICLIAFRHMLLLDVLPCCATPLHAMIYASAMRALMFSDVASAAFS